MGFNISDPKISFGIIVLNGEPFTRYCVQSLYPYAYQIIIAEGACEGARNIANLLGHSIDGTLEILREIKRSEDPENKITIITAEDEGHPDGFWPGEKLEQCQAYSKRVNGDYLWHVDIDEFYRDDDILKIVRLLHDDPAVTCISFKQIGFWGDFNYKVESWYLKRHLSEIYRIFKWGEGYQISSHRPPTVLNDRKENILNGKLISAESMKKMGIFMYHYSFVFPKQVLTKADYYTNSNWLSIDANNWALMNFMKISSPFRVFILTDYPSWLERFHGTHPRGIVRLIKDIDGRKTIIAKRRTDDIERLLNKKGYTLISFFLKYFEPIDLWISVNIRVIRSLIGKLRYGFKYL